MKVQLLEDNVTAFVADSLWERLCLGLFSKCWGKSGLFPRSVIIMGKMARSKEEAQSMAERVRRKIAHA